MTDVILEYDFGKKTRKVRLGKELASGGAGAVHEVYGESDIVVKLYNASTLIAHGRDYEIKIERMLRHAPSLPSMPDPTIVQLSWPVAMAREVSGSFVGFAMPRLDFRRTEKLESFIQPKLAKQKNLRTDLGARITVAANLAIVVSAIHQKGHQIVDLKPLNLQFYRQELYVAVLDCDGFAIQVPGFAVSAPQVTPEYLAPEFQGKPVTNPEQQDRFALAVIIFKLLNFGIHPYSGKTKYPSAPTDTEGKIVKGLYGYATIPHPMIDPISSSVHFCFPDEIRMLFDRAFGPIFNQRPNAREWGTVLNRYALTSNALLETCNAGHLWFSSYTCGECHRNAIRNGKAPLPTPISAPKNKPLTTNSSHQITPRTKPKWWFLFLIAFLIFYFYGGKDENLFIQQSPRETDMANRDFDADKRHTTPQAYVGDDNNIKPTLTTFDLLPFLSKNGRDYVNGMIQASIDHDETLVNSFKDKIESLPKPTQPNKVSRTKAISLINRGVSQLKMGDVSSSISIIEEALKEDPSDVEIVEIYGYALIKSGGFDKAQDALFAAVILNPERANAWSMLGIYYAVTNETQKAVACFSNVYRMLGNLAKTNDFFLKSLSQENNPKVILVLKSVIKEWAENIPLQELATSDKKDAPMEATNIDIIGINYVNNMIEASIVYDDALIFYNKEKLENLVKPQRGSRKLARKLNDQGLSFLVTNNYREAIPVLENAAATDPADAEIMNNLAHALHKNGDFEKALDVLIKTLLIDPSRVNAWSGLGFLYAMTNEPQKSVACFSNAYRMSKNPPKTHEFFLKALSEEKNSSVISILETVTTEWAIKLNINQPGSDNSTFGSSFEPRSEKTTVTITLTDLRKQADKLIAQKNFSEALPIVQKMVELNDAEAQNNLGYFYLTGKGIRKDEHKAVEWFSKAANQGYLTAQTNLGLLYLNGIGVPAESSSAFTWFEKAANQGDANAQYNLGLLHQNGEGVPTDLNKGIYWLRKSAAQGHTDAQSALYKIKDMADSNRMAEGVDAEMVDGQQSPFVPDFYARGKWAASNANFERAYYDCKIGAFRRANTNTTGFANDPNNPYKREYISCMHEAGFNVDR